MSEKINDFDGITEREDTKSKIPLELLIAALALAIWAVYYFINYFPLISGWSSLKEYEMAVLKNISDSDTAKPGTNTNPLKKNFEKNNH